MTGLVGLLISIIVICLIAYIVFWALGQIPLPDPIRTVSSCWWRSSYLCSSSSVLVCSPVCDMPRGDLLAFLGVITFALLFAELQVQRQYSTRWLCLATLWIIICAMLIWAAYG